jgi:hypothetical protein
MWGTSSHLMPFHCSYLLYVSRICIPMFLWGFRVSPCIFLFPYHVLTPFCALYFLTLISSNRILTHTLFCLAFCYIGFLKSHKSDAPLLRMQAPSVFFSTTASIRQRPCPRPSIPPGPTPWSHMTSATSRTTSVTPTLSLTSSRCSITAAPTRRTRQITFSVHSTPIR